MGLDAFWSNIGPHSHMAIGIPLSLLCQIVYSLGHLPRSEWILDAFWSNIGPYSHLAIEIPLPLLCQIVYSLGH